MKTPKAAPRHTPGPWKIVRRDVGDRYQVTIDILVGSNGEQVMHLSGGYGHPKQANVALITEAPDLLAALEGAVDWLRYASWDPDHQPLSWLHDANVAIARAKGQASK